MIADKEQQSQRQNELRIEWEREYDALIRNVKATSYLGWLTTGEYAYVIQNGIPLDDVKAEIKVEMNNLADTQDWGRYYGLGIALRILANIGKAESEAESKC